MLQANSSESDLELSTAPTKSDGGQKRNISSARIGILAVRREQRLSTMNQVKLGTDEDEWMNGCASASNPLIIRYLHLYFILAYGSRAATPPSALKSLAYLVQFRYMNIKKGKALSSDPRPPSGFDLVSHFPKTGCRMLTEHPTPLWRTLSQLRKAALNRNSCVTFYLHVLTVTATDAPTTT